MDMHNAEGVESQHRNIVPIAAEIIGESCSVASFKGTRGITSDESASCKDRESGTCWPLAQCARALFLFPRRNSCTTMQLGWEYSVTTSSLFRILGKRSDSGIDV